MKYSKYKSPEVTVVSVAATNYVCTGSDAKINFLNDDSLRPGFDGIEDL